MTCKGYIYWWVGGFYEGGTEEGTGKKGGMMMFNGYFSFLSSYTLIFVREAEFVPPVDCTAHISFLLPVAYLLIPNVLSTYKTRYNVQKVHKRASLRIARQINICVNKQRPPSEHGYVVVNRGISK